MPDILVVDDDHELCVLVGELLVASGHVVRHASDGQEGLRQLELSVPTLLIVDVEMPRLGGPGLVERLPRHDGLRAIPVVLTSGRPDLPAIAERLGTPYVLAKPWDAADMLAVVDRALRERAAGARTEDP